MRFSDSATQLLLLSPFLSHGAYGLKVGGFRCTAMPSFAHFGARKKKAKASSSAAAWLEPEGFSELSQVTVPEGDTEGKAEDYVGRFDFSLESPHRPEDVSKYRRAVVGGLALATIFSPHLNRALAKVWSTVRVTPWFRNDMFEPLVAVGSFFLWIHVWFGVDWLLPRPRPLPWLESINSAYINRDQPLH